MFAQDKFLRKLLAGAGVLMIGMMFCVPSVNAQPITDDDQKILHVLNRLTFGPRPGDIDDVKKMGVDAFIERQLHPDTIPMPPDLQQAIAANETIDMPPVQLFKLFSPQSLKMGLEKTGDKDADKKSERALIRQSYQKLYTEASAARLRRAVESPRQLEEVMVDFWFNHFNVSADKGLVHVWVGAYEQQAIRPYVFGKFRDMVTATAHHPAMLFYLDNWQNTAPQANGGQGFGGKRRANGLNENYARELMELHTLGVNGGYTQQDVIQLARILTGLGLPPAGGGLRRRFNGDVAELGPFGSYFDPNRHDMGDKVLLGHTIKGSGEHEIDEAIGILCRDPSTAHHISTQLAQYFVCDNPPDSLVKKLTDVYEKSDGNIRSILEALFHSPEFWDKQYVNAKFKSPYRYVVSSLRAANVALDDYKPVTNFFSLLGMPLYKCLTPDGYKNTEVAWLSPDALLQRITFATGLGTGRIPNNPLDPLDSDQVTKAMGNEFTQHTLDVVAQAPKPLRSAVLLGSPEFMNY